jgi:hypothetical protein
MIIACGFRSVFCTQFLNWSKERLLDYSLLVMVVWFYILASTNYIFYSTPRLRSVNRCWSNSMNDGLYASLFVQGSELCGAA